MGRDCKVTLLDFPHLRIILSIVFISLLSSILLAQPSKNDTVGTNQNVALLIANENYKRGLDVPGAIDNVRILKDSLVKVGLNVTMLINASQKEILNAIDQFNINSAAVSYSLFYYEGHTATINNTTYLLPIETKGKSEKQLIASGIALESIFQKEEGNTPRIIIINGCFRSNFKYLKELSKETKCYGFPNNFSGYNHLAFITPTVNTIVSEKVKSSGFAPLLSTTISKNRYIKKSLHYTSTWLPYVKNSNEDIISSNAMNTYMTWGGIKDDVDFLPSFLEAFPWPPPKASERTVINRDIFKGCQNFKDVDDILYKVLNTNGYDGKGYYLIMPEADKVQGFAIATRIEQINTDGTPKESPDRWRTSWRENSFSPFQYLKSIFLPEKGYFRVIVFVITDLSVKTTNSSPSRDTSLAWVAEGGSVLPAVIGAYDFTEDFNVTALIYEYEVPENNESAILVAPSSITGKTHLLKANLWTIQQLTKD
ncbi:caspase family protein [Ulvibacter antarcticus]|uniref:Caspase domain-containing protein n=1 Tax=Ulvibacter antarcticus TaxID=442714 RepID=A0A3L9YE15_9FLAO|nr:caspase family protein [Ulvibacter antarcticus]RMA58901.1 caspase domain-containing protein [Ulvibacter antarcticus]